MSSMIYSCFDFSILCLTELVCVCVNVQDTSKQQFCLRPPALPKRVKRQTITLVLKGSFVSGIFSSFTPN